MFSSILNSIFHVLFQLLKFVISASCVVLCPILFMCLVFFVFSLIKGKKIPRRKKKRIFKYNVPFHPFRVLLWDFPRRLVNDFFSRDPDDFDIFGVHVFCGEQGSGKSIAAVHFIKRILERNPCAKLASNIDLNFQDSTVEDFSDILSTNNGSFGQVIFLDEIQNWFSSNESRNFPPEMLTEITQQRKQRKCVVGTSQVFGRVSKPIREQITLLYRPFTVCGCLTFVRVYKVDLNEDGTVDKMHFRTWYAFVHDDELRNSYDTYEKVQRLSIKGFQPRTEQISNDITHINNTYVVNKK